MADRIGVRRPQPEMKKIRYIRGVMSGEIRTIKAAIADDLIERGYAIDMDREPGEEG